MTLSRFIAPAGTILLLTVVSVPVAADETFLSRHCSGCHSDGQTERISFDSLSSDSIDDTNAAVWEKIVRRLRARQMPPPDHERPAESVYVEFLKTVEKGLAARVEASPKPGHVDPIRRLTRIEYANAVRDIFGVHINPAEYFPADQEGHGFDNVTLAELPPVLLHRYISAAERIARIAVGGIGNSPSGRTVRIPADRSQDVHVAGLPLGTRGGTVFDHVFPQTGEYEIQLRLMRDRDEKIEGLRGEHEIDVLIDRRREYRFTVQAPKGGDKWGPDFTLVDAHLRKRLRIGAGEHRVGVTFPARSSSLQEIRRQPFDTSFNRHRHPRHAPAIFEVSIVGPFDPEGPGNTESRRKIFGKWLHAERTPDAAKRIIRRLVRLAFRREVTDEDVRVPWRFFERRFREDGFDEGLEAALAAILVNPHFLLRVESDESGSRKGPHLISQFELASRLSFFLWSSPPDDQLLDAAASGALHGSDALKEEVARMLVDSRSKSLVTNFAAQWLYLRNLASIQPDRRLFADFDDNLRQAMRQETELAFELIIRENRSILDLIRTDSTYLNERLAKHYGLPGVTGSEFRRVKLPSNSKRGGLLRHASILSVTSYATRTSPTIRGNWILENILGTPAPPPPANVPALKEKTTFEASTVRERLAIHRENPACAGCHNLMDPVGFALEGFDAAGRWREFDGHQLVDSAGALPDGTKIDSVESLEAGILQRPEVFVGTLAEKLMTFALGRGLTADDGPAIRKIVRNAEATNYAFSDVILGIVQSVPFQMRVSK